MLLSYAVIILLGLSASVAALIMMDQISGNLTVFYENNYAVTVKAWTAKMCIRDRGRGRKNEGEAGSHGLCP